MDGRHLGGKGAGANGEGQRSDGGVLSQPLLAQPDNCSSHSALSYQELCVRFISLWVDVVYVAVDNFLKQVGRVVWHDWRYESKGLEFVLIIESTPQ